MTDVKDVPINWEFTLRHLAAHCDSVSLHCAIRARLVEEVADHIATLTRKLNALTMHMNQVHATLGGTDTVLTLEAAQHVVFERDEARVVTDAMREMLATAFREGWNCGDWKEDRDNVSSREYDWMHSEVKAKADAALRALEGDA
jgi:hypothetical protein